MHFWNQFLGIIQAESPMSRRYHRHALLASHKTNGKESIRHAKILRTSNGPPALLTVSHHLITLIFSELERTLHPSCRKDKRHSTTFTIIMAACCPPGALGAGAANPSEPAGKTVVLSPLAQTSSRAEMPCYQVGPAKPKKIICVFTDVFGPEAGNHKFFCDRLQGILGEDTAVWMPDLFRGTPIMRGYFTGKMPWDIFPMMLGIPYLIWSIKTRITAPGVDQDLLEIVQAHAKETGCTYVGCVGFCFGGWTVARALGLEGGIFSAGVGVHPSFSIEGMIKGGSGSVETLIQQTSNKPILLLPAKQDKEAKPDSDLVAQLAKRRATVPSEISFEFPTMTHGFVARGDSTDPAVKAEQDKATDMVASFFKKHFK